MTLPYTIAAVGAVAQMGERINRTDEVRGSSPLSSTHGAVAKLGSRLNGIEKAEGSSPSGSTHWKRVLLVHHVLDCSIFLGGKSLGNIIEV